MIIEKIDPIIDKPCPLKSFSINFINPLLNTVIESTIDLVSPIEEEAEEITAEMETPKIIRQSNAINDATDTMKYFCCFGTTKRFRTTRDITLSVNP